MKSHRKGKSKSNNYNANDSIHSALSNIVLAESIARALRAMTTGRQTIDAGMIAAAATAIEAATFRSGSILSQNET